MNENLFHCPQALWNKMTEEDKAEYNRCMEATDFREWMELEGKTINDHRVLAHNFLICALPSFQKKK